MHIRNIKSCPEFLSGDHARLREIFHADKDGVAIRYSLAHAIVGSGITTKPHKLKTSEVYYIMEGTGRMHIDDESADVGPGDTVYIPPRAVQYIANTGNRELIFLCIVDPAWRIEDEIVL